MSTPAEPGRRRLPAGLATLADAVDGPVRDLHLDSRRVGSGDVFIALAGAATDGRRYAAEAVSQGAVAVLIEPGAMTAELRALSVPVLEVPDLRSELAQLAADFYCLDAVQSRLIGVTGTNGKTTISCMLAQLLGAMEASCALVGTLGWGFSGALREPGMTTPDAVSVARIVNCLDAEAATHIAMEVSSHGLAQQRVAAIDFDVVMFSNITRDHLDYHADMASYAAAKRELFTGSGRIAVLNLDDEFGRGMLHDDAIAAPKFSYSLADHEADVYCRALRAGSAGFTAELVTPWGEGRLHCPLPGQFNVVNLLACVTALGALGYPVPALESACAAVRGAPGRMEVVHRGGPMVIVDYAHTPDALEQVLRAARSHCDGQLWVIFGCGGNRDRGKRALMGEVAAAGADRVVVTSDNPRDEDPAAIAADILSGVASASGIDVVLERAAAIETALAGAAPGDVVVVAGKGHEDYQEVRGQRRPFSDSLQVERFFSRGERR